MWGRAGGYLSLSSLGSSFWQECSEEEDGYSSEEAENEEDEDDTEEAEEDEEEEEEEMMVPGMEGKEEVCGEVNLEKPTAIVKIPILRRLIPLLS